MYFTSDKNARELEKEEDLNIHQEKNDKSVEPKGSPIVKDEASTAKSSGDGGSFGDTAGCSGGVLEATKEDTSDCTLPVDSKLSKEDKQMLKNFKIAGEIVLIEDRKLLEELGRL